MMRAHLKLVHDADAPVHIVHQRFGSWKRPRDIDWPGPQRDMHAYQRELERESFYIITVFCTITLIWTACISWAIWGPR